MIRWKSDASPGPGSGVGIPPQQARVLDVTPAKTALGPDTNVAYCPMVKKSWVQKGNKIANPYTGMKGRSCGEIIKAVK